MNQQKVLIIDDDLLIRDMLYDFLLEKGYQVLTASDESAALDAIEAREFDAAIVDLKLPDGDGLSIMKKLKTARPEVAVIMVTGHPSDDIRDEAYQSGAEAFLEKPFKVTRLASILKRAIYEASHRKRPT
ncbi:MAG: hypothetical protein CO189_03990 [candidate division Zixibacteria bacterium CG_4_9_14_3_um_filter_46_8]|nr:MAG: hypothetical protein CO189_03990 [candidate division Zixibacteria bacterium CG_4_9_14_3_um_filter_46_8]